MNPGAVSPNRVSPRHSAEIQPQSPANSGNEGLPPAGSPAGSALGRRSSSHVSLQMPQDMPAARPPQRGTLAQRSTAAFMAASPVQAAVATATQALAGSRHALGVVLPPTRADGQPQAALQSALKNLKTEDTPAHQEAAHNAVIAYGQRAGTLGDRVLPVLHKASLIGVSGTAMAFGVGRNTGIATADTTTQAIAHQPQPHGVYAGGAAKPPGLGTLGQAAGEWVAGSLGGGVGNILGQHVVAPAINAVSRQHAAVAAKALVPDEMKDLMNELEAGSGDALRGKVQQRQGDIAGIGSKSNQHIGEVAFDVATAVRTAAQEGKPLGFAGTVGIGLSVSFGAGAAIGVTMAIRSAQATELVPTMAALREERAARQNNPAHDPKAPGELAQNKVPLFFTQHSEDSNPIRAIGKALTSSPVRDPAPSRQESDTAAPTRPMITAGDLANTVTSVGRRAVLMAKATSLTALATAVTPFVAHQMPNAATQSLVRTAGAAIGIHLAIKPWFKALASDIPQGDKRMQEARQPAVDQAYRRSAAAQPPAAELVTMTSNQAAGGAQGSQASPQASQGSQPNEGGADPAEPGPHQV
jgi:hypothetical protein